jgi:hypothetical protein
LYANTLSGGGASEFMTGEPDPVTDIAVGLKISSNESNAATQIEYFDAWHHTAKGNTYKRSEQYGDRSFNISKANEPIWLWQGRWIRDRNVFMIGQLAMTSRGSTYKEWILHGDPGPQNHGDEVTSSVCREVRQ